MSDMHPEEHGHWDLLDIRRLLHERDAAQAKLREAEELLASAHDTNDKVYERAEKAEARIKTLEGALRGTLYLFEARIITAAEQEQFTFARRALEGEQKKQM